MMLIGFLGQNLRYSDSPSFHGLQFFIQRHLSDATLDLEIKHLWKVYENLTMHEIPLIIIDSMGIDSRRKGFFFLKNTDVTQLVVFQM